MYQVQVGDAVTMDVTVAVRANNQIQLLFNTASTGTKWRPQKKTSLLRYVGTHNKLDGPGFDNTSDPLRTRSSTNKA